MHRAAVSALRTVPRKWQVWPGAHRPVGNLNVFAIELGGFYDVVMPNDTDAGDAFGLEDTPLTVQRFKQHTKGPVLHNTAEDQAQ